MQSSWITLESLSRYLKKPVSSPRIPQAPRHDGGIDGVLAEGGCRDLIKEPFCLPGRSTFKESFNQDICDVCNCRGGTVLLERFEDFFRFL